VVISVDTTAESPYYPTMTTTMTATEIAQVEALPISAAEKAAIIRNTTARRKADAKKFRAAIARLRRTAITITTVDELHRFDRRLSRAAAEVVEGIPATEERDAKVWDLCAEIRRAALANIEASAAARRHVLRLEAEIAAATAFAAAANRRVRR